MSHQNHKTCERCGILFLCKVDNIAECDCATIKLSTEERNYIATRYTDCICLNCLKELKATYKEIGEERLK